uniref:Uncharacterized protein n=1 Tax=viral metagenome TaxID=1070528 RepID=A0A6C0B0W4_9ZZZZ
MELNVTPQISDLEPVTYSMLINTDKSNKTTVIDQKKLVQNFKLDIKVDSDGIPGYTKKPALPAFISKRFFQIQNLEKPNKSDFSYSYPPNGPIEPDFVCLFCEEKGPRFHLENCKRPFDSSLVLDHTTPRFPGIEPGAHYDVIIKKSGQKKAVKEHVRSEKFTDQVEIIYESVSKKETTIRVSRNGTINIISANFFDNTLPGEIVKRINDTGASVGVYSIDPEKTYKYLLFAQFNLFPEALKKELIINLNTIDNNLWKVPIFKSSFQSRTIFKLNDDSFYYVSDYFYNTGDKKSKTGKLTNPYIIFTLIPPEGIVKIIVQVYLRGSVQLKASYLKGNTVGLSNKVIEDAYFFLKEIFEELLIYSGESQFNIIQPAIVVEKIFEDIPNMVPDKNGKPIKKPQKVHNRGKAGGHDLRPIPFSFNGKCPEPGYYVAPRGVRREDGKYEPICYVMKKTGKDSKARLLNMLINGYPDSEAARYGETVTKDDSAIYIPGTKVIEQRGFPGLNTLSKDELIACMKDKGYVRESNIFDKSKNVSSYQQFKASVPLPTLQFKKIKQITDLNFVGNFLVTPINNDTLRVKLYFDEYGKSYFVNTFKEVSESGISVIPELAGTVIDGYLYPFPKNFTFYPFDINDSLPFYGTSPNRMERLRKVVAIINTKPKSVNIELDFNLDVMGGSKNYLDNYPEISGLLFIPFDGKHYYSWTDIQHDSNMTVDLDISFIDKNRWKVTVQGKELPGIGVIELPVAFTNGKPKKMTVLFKINLRTTDFKLVEKKPFIPIEQLEGPVNSYDEVVGILESISSPIPRTAFTN